MDIKKPGPVKAHNFLKLNPTCKEILSIKRQCVKIGDREEKKYREKDIFMLVLSH